MRRLERPAATSTDVDRRSFLELTRPGVIAEVDCCRALQDLQKFVVLHLAPISAGPR